MDERSFSVIFFGTNTSYSTYPINQIIRSYPVTGIIESAPRVNPSGRFLYPISVLFEQWFNPHSLYRFSRKHHIPYFFYPADRTAQLIKFIRAHPADVGVVASMNHLLPPDVLSLLPQGIINMHPSLLPDLRGPLVWPWYYYYNDQKAGVTIHFLDAGEDSGDIIRQEEFTIRSGLSSQTLIRQCTGLGTRLLLDSLEQVKNGACKPCKQPLKGNFRRARRLKKHENLFPYQTWNLEHCFHFLQGVKRWYDPFQWRQKSLGIVDWEAFTFSRQPIVPQKSGSFGLDWHGLYFKHPEGKIYLKLRVNILPILWILLLIMAGLNILINH